jgi:hypothetical protein
MSILLISVYFLRMGRDKSCPYNFAELDAINYNSLERKRRRSRNFCFGQFNFNNQ